MISPEHTAEWPRPDLNQADFAPIHLTMYQPTASAQVNIIIHSPVLRSKPLWPRTTYNQGFTNPQELWDYMLALCEANKTGIRDALDAHKRSITKRPSRPKMSISLDDLDLEL